MSLKYEPSSEPLHISAKWLPRRTVQRPKPLSSVTVVYGNTSTAAKDITKDQVFGLEQLLCQEGFQVLHRPSQNWIFPFRNQANDSNPVWTETSRINIETHSRGRILHLHAGSGKKNESVLNL